jgi:predicted  nucleic acid-binding Zn-ribbon protein
MGMECLGRLWELQQVRLKLRRLEDQLAKNPELIELKKTKKDILLAEEVLAGEEQKLHEMEMQLRSKEHNLAELTEKGLKLLKRLYGNEAKGHKELTSLQQQINLYQKEKNQLEETILSLTDMQEKLRAKVQAERERLNKAVQLYKQKLLVFQEGKQHLDDDRSILKAELNRLAKGIPPEIIKLYQEMVPRYADLVVSKLEDRRCGACRVQVAAWLIRDLRKGEGLVNCESCGRLLYWEKPQEGG